MITVIIPHLNQAASLAQCLASLRAGRRPPDHIIVVDNGSKALPHDVLSAFREVTLLEEPTPGPGPARNRAVAAAAGDILAFIDADCLADPGWLEAAQAALQDPKIMILGGDVRIALQDPQNLTMLEAYESIYAYRMDRYIAEQGFTGTGNLVMRRHVFDDVGPFAGLGTAEDRDWGHRARAKGYHITYAAQMRVYHPARTTFAALYAKWDRQLGHDYSAAAGRGRLIWALKTCAMAVSPLIELPRILTCTRIRGPRARLLAFLGLTRIRFYRMRRMAWLLCGGDPKTLSARWNRT